VRCDAMLLCSALLLYPSSMPCVNTSPAHACYGAARGGRETVDDSTLTPPVQRHAATPGVANTLPDSYRKTTVRGIRPVSIYLEMPVYAGF
jgi:hypothetical protein